MGTGHGHHDHGHDDRHPDQHGHEHNHGHRLNALDAVNAGARYKGPLSWASGIALAAISLATAVLPFAVAAPTVNTLSLARRFRTGCSVAALHTPLRSTK
jgi:hypothetical protein